MSAKIKEKELSNKHANIVVVKEIDDEVIRNNLNILKKITKKNSDINFVFKTNKISLLVDSEFDFSDFEDDFAFPFDLKEGNKIDSITCILYHVKNKVSKFTYIFEIDV